ncbi:tryptophan-rich sensory protein [Planomonospora venezuelensis]|uniref:Tryptophan-rich sensory protein n=1 Tax=Planomonospora venezuelensis TaxID=1999 RepID=A0A841DFE9_PLAVE|nr:tryptophan-rich sensory protein [Planomonospora venezuelensis]MBB5965976.1 tryptophan-rich sensory protein [Planomonospora venezuelensis]GIN01270.1 hypothetical protein Pve01_29280 [Planomonospora venezuelensis]
MRAGRREPSDRPPPRPGPPAERTRTETTARARPKTLAGTLITALNVSNAALIRQAWGTDRAAGAALLPYGAWTLFATALTTAIVRLNPGDA